MATGIQNDVDPSGASGGSATTPRGGIKKGASYFVEVSSRTPTYQVEYVGEDMKQQIGARNLLATGCTICEGNGKYSLRPLVGTTTERLGEYGVGVELYFDFLYYVGILFAMMFVLSMPAIVMSLLGNRMWSSMTAQDWGWFYQSLGTFSIANIGYCDHDSCATKKQLHERPLLKGSGTLLRDVTGTLAVLDGISTSLFLLFGIWFHFYWIQRTKAKQDTQCITPADYSIHVENLPNSLHDPELHARYEQLLAEHFKQVLGADDPEAVQEVTCIREYDGAICTYMTLGELIKLRRNFVVKQKHANEENNLKAEERYTKQAEKIHKKIERLEASVSKNGPLADEERDVCAAYVMFNREDQKAKVLEKYGRSRSWCGRLRQSEELRFQGKRLKVSQACEPNDLYWENLDFNPRKHWCRRVLVRVLAFIMLLFAIQLMVLLKSKGNKLDTSLKPASAWVLRRPQGLEGSGPGSCLRICDWRAYEALECSGNSWQSDGIFEARGAVANSMMTSGQCWESPLCSNSSFGRSRDWVGVRLASPAIMRCTQFDQLGPDPAEQLEVYACEGVSVPTSSASLMDWDPERHCSRMANLRLPHPRVSAGTRVPTDDQLMRHDENCAVSPSLEAAQHAKDAGAKPNDIKISCFCIHQVKEKGVAFRVTAATTPEQEVCYDWSNEENLKQLRFAAGILAVLVLNQVQLLIFSWFDSWTRYRTATELASSQLYNLFGAQLINTGIVVVLVGMNLQGSMNNVPVLDKSSVGKGSYDDVGLVWFLEIGTGLFTAILGQMASAMIVPAFFALVLDPLYRRWASKSLATAETICALYQYAEFGLSLRLAETLTVIFCVMMYSGIMPLLYLLGALYCASSFWIDKWILLRKACKPPAYTETIISWAAQLLPVAGLAHIGAVMWMYGNQDLFPSNWSWYQGFSMMLVGMDEEEYRHVMDVYPEASSDVKPDLYEDYFQARMVDSGGRNATLTSVIMLWVICILLIVHLFWDYLPDSVGVCIRKILGKVPGMAGMQAGNTDVPYTQAQADATLSKQLFSYKLSQNDRYKEAHNAIMYDIEHDNVIAGEMSGVAQVFDKADKAAGKVGHFLQQGEDKVTDGVERLVDRFASGVNSVFAVASYKRNHTNSSGSLSQPTSSVGSDMPVPVERPKDQSEVQEDADDWKIDSEDVPASPPTIDARPAVVPTSNGMTTGSAAFFNRTAHAA